MTSWIHTHSIVNPHLTTHDQVKVYTYYPRSGTHRQERYLESLETGDFIIQHLRDYYSKYTSPYSELFFIFPSGRPLGPIRVVPTWVQRRRAVKAMRAEIKPIEDQWRKEVMSNPEKYCDSNYAWNRAEERRRRIEAGAMRKAYEAAERRMKLRAEYEWIRWRGAKPKNGGKEREKESQKDPVREIEELERLAEEWRMRDSCEELKNMLEGAEVGKKDELKGEELGRIVQQCERELDHYELMLGEREREQEEREWRMLDWDKKRVELEKLREHSDIPSWAGGSVARLDSDVEREQKLFRDCKAAFEELDKRIARDKGIDWSEEMMTKARRKINCCKPEEKRNLEGKATTSAGDGTSTNAKKPKGLWERLKGCWKRRAQAKD